jgi:hypothetical protein
LARHMQQLGVLVSSDSGSFLSYLTNYLAEISFGQCNECYW